MKKQKEINLLARYMDQLCRLSRNAGMHDASTIHRLLKYSFSKQTADILYRQAHDTFKHDIANRDDPLDSYTSFTLLGVDNVNGSLGRCLTIDNVTRKSRIRFAKLCMADLVKKVTLPQNDLAKLVSDPALAEDALVKNRKHIHKTTAILLMVFLFILLFAVPNGWYNGLNGFAYMQFKSVINPSTIDRLVIDVIIDPFIWYLCNK